MPATSDPRARVPSTHRATRERTRAGSSRHPVDLPPHRVEVEIGFAEDSPDVQRVQRCERGGVIEGGQHHHGRVMEAEVTADHLEERQPVHHRHPYVKENEVGLIGEHMLESELPVGGAADLVTEAPQVSAQRLAEIPIIVHQQHLGHGYPYSAGAKTARTADRSGYVNDTNQSRESM